MSFRASPYIDFDTGTVVKTPMDLPRTPTSPGLLNEMLDLFECRVDVWQFGPAVEILKQIEAHSGTSIWAHSAYALLAVVFTYFEMIGKILNPNSQASHTSSTDFNYGFCDVYPTFITTTNGDRTDAVLPDVKEFRNRVRNGIYHLGYTKGNLFIHNEPEHFAEDFFVDRSLPEPMYLVNPHQLTRRVVAHFPDFMRRLRDPDEQFEGLRLRFRRFFEEFHGLR